MNNLTLNIYKSFGLQKRRLSDREKEAQRKEHLGLQRWYGFHPEVENEEGGNPNLPFGMNPKQYRIMVKHFKVVWPYNPDSQEGERDAWFQFANEYGPWYARGLYGRVHEVPERRASHPVERGILPSGLSLTPPHQWHSKGDFATGIPGQAHPDITFRDGGRGHGLKPDGSLELDSLEIPKKLLFTGDRSSQSIHAPTFHPKHKIVPEYRKFYINPQDVTADTLKPAYHAMYAGYFSNPDAPPFVDDEHVSSNLADTIGSYQEPGK